MSDKEFTTIIVAADHAGYKLKEEVMDLLNNNEEMKRNLPDNPVILDIGCFSEDSVDYPDYVHAAVKFYRKGSNDMIILICGSGNGVAITANKYPFIRAAVCWNSRVSMLARAHNDANTLCIPSRFIDKNELMDIVYNFITIPFEEGRHSKRVNKMTECTRVSQPLTGLNPLSLLRGE